MPTPASSDSPADAPGPLMPLIGLVLGGAAIGAAHLGPAFAPLAWAGIALTTFGLARSRQAGWTIAGLLAGGLAELYIGHPWHVPGLGYYLPGGPSVATAASLPYHLLLAMPVRVALFIGWAINRRFRGPIALWLPFAWLAGEAGLDAALGISHAAWLYSQWQVLAVLRAVGHVGWEATLLICLAAAAAFGQALADRRWTFAGLGCIGLAALALMPAVPAGDLRALRGVGAVHTAASLYATKQAPTGVSLVVWPELAYDRVVRVEEGRSSGRKVRPPYRKSQAFHLLGARTTVRGRRQNALLALSPTGSVLGVRAKERLFPFTERPWGGWSLDPAAGFMAGAGRAETAALPVGGRRVAGLICVEAVDRALSRRAREAGATLLAICSNDTAMGNSPVAREQMLAIATFRAVETRLPVVRAARNGPAALIAADGRLLAVSPPATDGVLTLGGSELAPISRPAPEPGQAVASAVLYSRRTPELQAALPPDRCAYFPVEGFHNPGIQAATVVVAGHSLPPTYLGQPAEVLAGAIASFGPELVVLDTCYGASLPILEALAAKGVAATVVAPPYRIPEDGFVYGERFLDLSDPAARAGLIGTEPTYPLLRWKLEPQALRALRGTVDRWSGETLRRRLKRTDPPLVRAELPGVAGSGASVLVPVPVSRFRRAP